ncbi:MAG: hypothetical protein FWE98_04060 [Oscillospiraceae bacterium]|nr:hypothetical protein [Oscillospiraceae bacterium]
MHVIIPLIGIPCLLTLANLVFLCLPCKQPKVKRAGIIVELVTMVLGVSLFIYAGGLGITSEPDWYEVIDTQSAYSPLASWAQSTFWTFIFLAIAAYFPLRFIPVAKMPPLLAVLCIAAIYAGAVECILYIVQIFPADENFFSIGLLPPINCLLIGAKAIKDIAREKCAKLPLWALLALLPFMGVVVGILFLAGQKPDSFITVFTETAEWNLSTKTPPPRVEYTGHYLCTVAAKGHRRLVRPLRVGRRHGAPILVNRQLCVANAFEQLIQQRTPRLHRCVRYAYDNTGFHLSKHIHSRAAADAVYLLMKPLEWAFLFVLYLCTARPEERISSQYR